MAIIPALLIKEFQTWIRGQMTFAAFTLLVLLVSLLVFLLGLLILAPDANAAPALFSTTANTSANLLVQNRAMFLFGAVGLCLLLAAGVVGPTVAASAFAGERERRTIDLLLLQGPGPWRVVLGKVLAALIFSLVVLLLAIPLFAPAWSFGGVGREPVAVLAVVTLTATLLFCSLGVFFGAILPTALQAALFSLGTSLFLLFGTLGLHMSLITIGGNDSLKPILWLNPFLALLSGGGTTVELFARQAPIAYRGVLALPLTTALPGFAFPAWQISSFTFVLLSILLTLAAAIAIDPCHPVRRLWPRRAASTT